MNQQQDKWRELQEKINETIAAWRQEHPTASLTEIEEVVDNQIAPLRTQMVQDLANEGKTADLRGLSAGQRPVCPRCGQASVANGKGKRNLKTTYGQVIQLERHQAYCPHCKVTFFPSG